MASGKQLWEGAQLADLCSDVIRAPRGLSGFCLWRRFGPQPASEPLLRERSDFFFTRQAFT